jgi:hypothetical protein
MSVKNISLTSVPAFPIDSLTYVDKNITKEMLGLPHGTKVFLVKLRQKWIIQNDKQIQKLKEDHTTDVAKNIEKMYALNEVLYTEIEKLRYTCVFERQAPILDSYEYQAYFNTVPASKLETEEVAVDTLNEILKNYPQLMLDFSVATIKAQKTDIAVPLVKAIANDHLFTIRISRTF